MKDSNNRKPRGYWNIKENCLQESLKYETRLEFQKGSVGAYRSSRKNGWLDEVCNHMVEGKKPNGHWNIKENCRKEALKYNTRLEFNKGSVGAYNSSRKNGWLDDICKDMDVVGNLKMRGIYVFEFEDNYAYVGLSGNFDRRYNEHINDVDCVVYKHIEGTNLTPKFIQLTDYMDEELASKEETEWENKYISNGWNMLNIKKTGGLGGCNLKWDFESCKKEAKKYNTRSEFEKKSSGAYQSSLRNGWLVEFFPMVEERKSRGYWTIKENCLQESLKYETRLEFQKGSVSSYNSSLRNGWLDEICGHMVEERKPKGHWDIKENCKEEALNYNTRSEFSKGSVGAYQSSRKNGWLVEFFPKTKKVVVY